MSVLEMLLSLCLIEGMKYSKYCIHKFLTHESSRLLVEINGISGGLLEKMKNF